GDSRLHGTRGGRAPNETVTSVSVYPFKKVLERARRGSKSGNFLGLYAACVASRLLRSALVRAGLAAWVLVSTACVLPQETTIVQPPPALQNRPPRIIEEQALLNGSGDRIVYTGSGLNCSLDFSLKVSDPDLADVLLVNWYAYQHSQPLL